MIHYRQGGEKNNIGGARRELMAGIALHAMIASHLRPRMRIE
ncbi:MULTISPECIES: hypothetical protein [Stenotrophomonas]|jgi:hypothetical protein|nr:hypothetical protein [Stenotrophomonas sp. 704A1]